MYYVEKRMEIAAAHCLTLPYDSKCTNFHGHNYIVVVYCKCEKLTDHGMVVDFAHIKQSVHNVLDHGFLNDVMCDLNPTAENMAKWIMDRVNEYELNPNTCYKVSVQESEGNIAIYEV